MNDNPCNIEDEENFHCEENMYTLLADLVKELRINNQLLKDLKSLQVSQTLKGGAAHKIPNPY